MGGRPLASDPCGVHARGWHRAIGGGAVTRHARWYGCTLLVAALATAATPHVVAAAAPGQAVSGAAPSHGRWVDVGPMSSKHESAHVVRLASGRVLVAGGGGTSSDMWCSRKVDRYDPRADRWTAMTPMPYRRCSPTVRLAGERVLVVGGEGFSLNRPTRTLRTALIFNADTNRWHRTLSMHHRGAQVAVRLAGRRVLVIGGGSGRWAEVYDIAARTWHRAPRSAVEHSVLVRLRNGDVLAFGKLSPSPGPCAEIYSPVARTWGRAGRYRWPCRRSALTWSMPDGRVLIQSETRHVRVYNPDNQHWRSLPSLPMPQRDNGTFPQASVQGIVGVRGQPMVIASRAGCTPSGARTVGYLWRPDRHRWVAWTTLSDGGTWMAVTRLTDGSVLLAGGVRWHRSCPMGGDLVPSRLAYRYYPDG